jgi:hypothetical protein
MAIEQSSEQPSIYLQHEKPILTSFRYLIEGVLAWDNAACNSQMPFVDLMDLKLRVTRRSKGEPSHSAQTTPDVQGYLCRKHEVCQRLVETVGA